MLKKFSCNKNDYYKYEKKKTKVFLSLTFLQATSH